MSLNCSLARSWSLSLWSHYDAIVMNNSNSNPSKLSIFDKFHCFEKSISIDALVWSTVQEKSFCLQPTEQINSPVLVSSVHVKSVVKAFSSRMRNVGFLPVYLPVSDSLWFLLLHRCCTNGNCDWVFFWLQNPARCCVCVRQLCLWLVWVQSQLFRNEVVVMHACRLFTASI